MVLKVLTPKEQDTISLQLQKQVSYTSRVSAMDLLQNLEWLSPIYQLGYTPTEQFSRPYKLVTELVKDRRLMLHCSKLNYHS